MSSITVAFGTDMARDSVTRAALYRVQRGVRKRGKLVFAAALRVRDVTYDPATRSATIRLARPVKGPIRITIAAGASSADGRATTLAVAIPIH